MNELRQDVILPREKFSVIPLFFAGWGLFIMGMAVVGITDNFTTWKLPVWKMNFGAAIFITLFMTAWFGLLSFVVGISLRGVQQVRITDEEVRICLGPVVLKRLSLMQVKSVVRTGDILPAYGARSLAWVPRNRHGAEVREPDRLILCTVPAEELREMSRSFLEKQKMRSQLQRMQDRSIVSNAAVKKHIRKNLRINRFWLEYTPEAEAVLRKHLTSATFIM